MIDWDFLQKNDALMQSLKGCNQCERVLKHLQCHGSLTALTALNNLGIYRLAARVYDLRRQGHDVKKRTVNATNQFDEPVSFAEYYL